ncbi:MAG: hypothetical protein COA33_009250 [Fluviicola sp.]|nr:hypothetical protein [Fluviicola sp.]
MKLFSVIFTLLILTACGSSDNGLKDLKVKIEQKEEAIKELSKDLRPNQKIPVSEREELVDLLLGFYHSYPKNEFAPVSLDKLHMIYSATREYQKSADYGDTLLNNYPNYINRALILESMAVNYDLFIQPRDTSKVRKYNEILLKENPDFSPEKIEGIQFKLDNLGLTMEELIMERNK